ncbi:MAG: LacI family DNA-binding transcriptional regulator [Thermoleophilia bacterium]|nr:LacI family DNA-binding transcriptional regulator [Thermoleophilia bacterium]
MRVRPVTRAPRLRDVAAAAGVDASVVSRILSGDRRLSVRPETRQRVLEHAARLGYRPNRAARALKTARTMAIGMIVPDLANAGYATIAIGAAEAAAVAGYVLLVAHGPASDRVPDLHGRIDGLLVGMATSETPGRVDLGGVPALLVNRREPLGIPSVTVDDAAGAELATAYLISLGHRRIAHVAGPQLADTARRRLRGYASALRAAGIELGPEWVAEAPFDEAGGDAAAARLLALEPRPTALFAGSVRAAAGAMAAARRLGLRLPRDLSLVGLNDSPCAAYLDSPLTTVRMPLAEMGREAVGGLLGLLRGEAVADLVVAAPPELVVRASAGPPAR